MLLNLGTDDMNSLNVSNLIIYFRIQFTISQNVHIIFRVSMFYPVVTSQTPIKCWIMVVFLAVMADVARWSSTARNCRAL